MTDLIQEIYGTIMRNKLRTALTGFAVAWGIYMLIVLLGAGNGLIHAFENQSADMKMNSMKIYPGFTSKAFNGLNEGRNISLNESDMKITSKSSSLVLSQDKASACTTSTTSWAPNFSTIALSPMHPLRSSSMLTTRCAPRLAASNPNAPEPANISQQVIPAKPPNR